MEITSRIPSDYPLKAKAAQQCCSGARKAEEKPESKHPWGTLSYSDSLLTLTLWSLAASL